MVSNATNPRFRWDFRTAVSEDPCLTTSPRHRGGAIRADAESCRRPDDRSTGVDRQEWRTQARRVAVVAGRPCERTGIRSGPTLGVKPRQRGRATSPARIRQVILHRRLTKGCA
ncbi:hypothetical protein SGPA1_20652 [Streptomyces misionensis JCM 4497]